MLLRLVTESAKPQTAITQPQAAVAKSQIRQPSAPGCLVFVAGEHGLHLTAAQLSGDNPPAAREIGIKELRKRAGTAGMRAKAARMCAAKLVPLRNAFPPVQRLLSPGSEAFTADEGRLADFDHKARSRVEPVDFVAMPVNFRILADDAGGRSQWRPAVGGDGSSRRCAERDVGGAA